MKRLLKNVRASVDYSVPNYTFTPDDVVSLLSKIPELSEYEINYSYDDNGTLQFIVGENAYQIID